MQRPAKILVIAENYGQAKQVQGWIDEYLAEQVQTITVVYTFKEAEREFLLYHPDLILICACTDEEKIFNFAKHTREFNGSRHVGLMVYYLEEILSDEFVIKCLGAGVDDCIPSYINPSVKKARVQAVIKFKRITDELRHANYQLKKMSISDDLTGLYNMRGFEKRMQILLSECRSRKSSLGLIMLDLDHFKTVNDTMNHLVGSQVIEEVGRLIGTLALGQNIYCARYGGDEFIIAMQLHSAQKCVEFAELLRTRIKEMTFNFESKRFGVTASIGLHWVPKGSKISGADLVKAADKMLYRSKELGRDRVCTTHCLDSEKKIA